MSRKDEQRQPSSDARKDAGAGAAGNIPGKRTRAGDDDAAGGEENAGGLPGALRQKYEATLGVSLGGVRVHTGADAASAAQGVGARAYAEGQDIYFGAGQYNPSSPEGEHLIAHEVAHTVQQSKGGGEGGIPKLQLKSTMTAPGDRFEQEADRAADSMVAGTSFSIAETSGVQVARKSACEREFLQALSMVGEFHSVGMVETETNRVMNTGVPAGWRGAFRAAIYDMMMVSAGGGPAEVQSFEVRIRDLLRGNWIGADTAHQALMLVEDHESVTTMLALGKSPVKIALAHAREKKKQEALADAPEQQSNTNVLIRAFEKIALSPFPSTAEYEAEHGNFHDVPLPAHVVHAASLRGLLKTVMTMFASAFEAKNAHGFHEETFTNLHGLLGQHGTYKAYSRGKHLIAGARGDDMAPGDFKKGEGPEKGDKLETAIKILEAGKIGALKPLAEFLANALKLSKDTNPGDIINDITGLAGAVFEAVKNIVEMVGGETELALQACSQLEMVGKVLSYGGSAAMAVKHLHDVYAAKTPRARFEAVTNLLGDIPGPIGTAIKLSFAELRWLGEEFNQIRVASKDVALKEFFYADAPIAPEKVPALLKAKVRMIRDLPVDAQHARRTYGMLDPNPSDPESSCQEIFQGLQARRAWAIAARSIHDQYRQGAYGIDGSMDWKAPAGVRSVDEKRVEGANAMKRAIERFIEGKISELVKQTGAVE